MKPHVILLKSTGFWPAIFLDFADRCKNIDEVWAKCRKPDFMLTWISRSVSRGYSDHRKLVYMATQLVKGEMPAFEKSFPDDTRVRACFEATEAWLEAAIKNDELREKADLARQSAATANFHKESSAGYAASAVAQAAHITWAPHDVGLLSYLIGNVDTLTERAVKVKLEKTADRIREHYPTPPPLLGVESPHSDKSNNHS